MNYYSLILFTLLNIIIPGLSLNNGLGRTPPMGWNSWKQYGCAINQFEIQKVAEAFIDLQLDKVGYKYVILDDCWVQTRDSNGKLMPDLQLFPNIIDMIQYVHSKGLLFGLCGDAGTLTCSKRPGSLGYEVRDAQQFADMKVDYLKYDNCHSQGINMKKRYSAMRDALNKTGRPIFYSLCEWGIEDPATWAPDVGNSWRTTVYILDEWIGVMSRADANDKWAQYAAPGGWNDPDVLAIGNGGMSLTEEETQMSLWCLMKAPLIISGDLTSMSNDSRHILTNEEVIAVNQDPLGIQGKKVKIRGDTEVWGGPLSEGSYAVLLLNRGDVDVTIKMDWNDLNLERGKMYEVRDLWKHTNLGPMKDQVSSTVPSHGVKMYKLTPA